MIRLILVGILILLIARAFWRLVDGILEAAGGGPRRRAEPRAPAMKLVRDPVCGTHVRPDSAVHLTAGRTTYYFCSEACRSRFQKTA